MRKWEFKDYVVYEETDVLRFENNDGDIMGYVALNGDIEELAEQLDNGADPIKDGWEDGNGNTLSIEGWGEQWEKLNIYIIYSDDVGAPVDKFNDQDDLYYEADRMDEAENTDDCRYEHWYRKEVDEDYGITRFEYVTTKNARN